MTLDEYAICLMTVPHTGAHFVTDLLETVGLLLPNEYTTAHWPTYSKSLPPESKFLITVRDPYLSALRYLYNGYPIEDAAKSWNICLANLYNVDHYIIDIGCRKEDRLEHICSAIKFINMNPDNYMEKLQPYVDLWTPIHTTEESIARGRGVDCEKNNKSIYLETGGLPNGHDWSLLDNAVEWYKALPTNDCV